MAADDDIVDEIIDQLSPGQANVPDLGDGVIAGDAPAPDPGPEADFDFGAGARGALLDQPGTSFDTPSDFTGSANEISFADGSPDRSRSRTRRWRHGRGARSDRVIERRRRCAFRRPTSRE
jgi:hypothetical protein